MAQEMKQLNNFIIEKLKLNKDIKDQEYNYFPKDNNELRKIIIDLIKERGKDLDLNDIDTSNITVMQNVFYEMNDITSIDVSNWDVSNVTNMAGMFCSCENLKKIIGLDKWNTENLINTNAMFAKCINLEDIGDLNKWNTKKLKDMQWMFSDCTKLSVDISSWDIHKPALKTKTLGIKGNAPGVIVHK